MEIFKSIIAQTDWSVTLRLCDEKNTEAAYESFINHIKSAYNTAFPLVPRSKHKRHSYKQPWMTPGLLKSCKTKSKLYLKFFKNPSLTNKQKFTSFRNKFKTLRIKAERSYYRSYFRIL